MGKVFIETPLRVIFDIRVQQMVSPLWIAPPLWGKIPDRNFLESTYRSLEQLQRLSNFILQNEANVREKEFLLTLEGKEKRNIIVFIYQNAILFHSLIKGN